MMKKGLILVGHGSRLEYNKQLITETAKQMNDLNNEYIIKSCFMEMSTPTITDAMSEMSENNIDLLVVVPLFLAKGIHVLQDIPTLIGLESGANKGTFNLKNGKTIPLIYAEPIGIDPLLAKLMLKNAEKAIDKFL